MKNSEIMKRREQLVAIIRTAGKINTEDAAVMFGVSKETIRQDLQRRRRLIPLNNLVFIIQQSIGRLRASHINTKLQLFHPITPLTILLLSGKTSPPKKRFSDYYYKNNFLEVQCTFRLNSN